MGYVSLKDIALLPMGPPRPCLDCGEFAIFESIEIEENESSQLRGGPRDENKEKYD